MLSKTLAYSALAATAQAAASDHWAVIVAGSAGFSNYRHQSDTCHAYQIFKAHGIPESNIIHLSTDDIANNSENPVPGKMFNKPTAAGTPGVDVYAGCQIDYKGNDVTAANILAVLQGDSATAGGKVLKSNENSKVFFYYADHGGSGLIGTPVGPYLYADQLQTAYKFMQTNKMYKEMTIYMEACESGSMFSNILPTDMEIYALSASNPTESSWGTYCAPNDNVNGVEIGSCLGDLFSVNWMEDSDNQFATQPKNLESLQTQWKSVHTLTTQSDVMQWGQLTFTSESIGDFQSTDAPALISWNHFGLDKAAEPKTDPVSVDSREAKMHYLYNKANRNPSTENLKALQDYVSYMQVVNDRFQELYPQHMEGAKNGTLPLPTNFTCYRQLMTAYEKRCERMEDYSLKFAKVFAAECESLNNDVYKVVENVKKITDICSRQ